MPSTGVVKDPRHVGKLSETGTGRSPSRLKEASQTGSERQKSQPGHEQGGEVGPANSTQESTNEAKAKE